MNMKKMIWILTFLFAFNMFYIGKIFALQREDKKVLELLENIEKASWKEKREALKEIRKKKMKVSDIARNKLIDIFEKESKLQEEYVAKLKKQGLSINKAMDRFDREHRKEGYVRYYSDFVTLVTSFKDTRSIPSLLKGLYYYGGAVVPTHIIGIGEDAVEPLLDLLKSKNRTLKSMAFFVLSLWVNAPIESEDYTITESMSIKDKMLLNKIKIAFINALTDKEKGVRRRAIYGLRAFPEEEVIHKLEWVVENDPDKKRVKESAKRTIEMLKSKRKAGHP